MLIYYDAPTIAQEKDYFFMNKQENTSIKEDAEAITIEIEQPKHNFIIVYDTIYKNNNLTANEIALLIKLLSIAPTFKPTSQKLAKILHLEIRELTKASKGLQEKGYLKIEKQKNSNSYIWKVSQTINIETKAKEINKIDKLICQNIDTLLKTNQITQEEYNETIERMKQLAKINIWKD